MNSQKLSPTRGSPINPAETSFISQLTMKDIIFILALATKPLYLRSSGSLQVSDLLFVLLFGMLCFSRASAFQSPLVNKWLIVFSACLVYQICVNVIAYFQLQSKIPMDDSLLKSNLYYIFNFLVCLSVLQIHALKGYSYTLKLYLIGSALSVLVSLIGVAIQYRGKGRAIGFFNNPNQLGYFCIVISTGVTFFAKEIKPAFRIVLIALCVGMCLVSLSKASIVSCAVLLFAFFVNSRDRVGPAKLISVLLSIIVVAALIYIIMYADIGFLNSNPLIVSLRSRMAAITTENDSNLGTGRGYDRIKEIGFGVFTGVGEGAFNRFSVMRGKEAHSLYASFIVSYGIIGFTMLVWIINKALFSRKRYLRNLLCFSGVLGYCVTHNGVRSTILWAMLTLLLLRPKPAPAAEPDTPPDPEEPVEIPDGADVQPSRIRN